MVRADTRQRWGSLLLLIVLAGVAGGIAMAAVAGARRTTTSWDRLRAADGASDLNLYADIRAGGARADVTPEDLARLREIPGAWVAGANIMPLSPGLMGLDRSGDAGLVYALDDESLSLALRPRHLRGRVPDRPDEVVVNEAVADGLGLDVGDRFTLRTSTVKALDACITEPSCAIEEPPPLDVVVSGISRQASDLDPDALNTFLLFAGPRFAELLTDSHPVLVFFGSVFLDADTGDAAQFLSEVERRFPDRFGSEVSDPASASVHDVLAVEASALLALAAVAASAGALSAAQGFFRHLAGSATDRDVLAALGMTRRDRVGAAAWSGVVIAVGATALAVAVAIVGSPLLPVGLGRRAEPSPGVSVDGVVIGLGATSILLVLAVGFAALSHYAVGRRFDEPAPGRARSTRVGSWAVPVAVPLERAWRSARPDAVGQRPVRWAPSPLRSLSVWLPSY